MMKHILLPLALKLVKDLFSKALNLISSFLFGSYQDAFPFTETSLLMIKQLFLNSKRHSTVDDCILSNEQ